MCIGNVIQGNTAKPFNQCQRSSCQLRKTLQSLPLSTKNDYGKEKPMSWSCSASAPSLSDYHRTSLATENGVRRMILCSLTWIILKMDVHLKNSQRSIVCSLQVSACCSCVCVGFFFLSAVCLF